MSYASQHGFSQYGDSSSSSSAPLVAPPMSESSSRGAHGLGGETFFVSRGPPRAPYSVEYRDRSGSESYHLNGHSYSSLSSAGLDSSSAAAAAYDQAMQADVSTIFVVGFPDDMTEREFSNMFAFAEGFEAATLKFPYPRDGSVAGSEGGGIGGVEDPLSSSYPGPHYLATAHEGFATSAGTGASTPLSTTASANGTSTPASTPARKIIGFARFDTRTHALAARDTLSGRRVDYERGSVLKAEMAKKNLHMRKNVVVTATAMSGSGSGGSSGATTGSGLSSAAGTTAPGSATGYGSTQQQQQSPYVYSALHGSPVAVQQAPSSLSSTAPDPAGTTAGATSSSSAPGGSTGPSIPLSSLDPATLQKLARSSNVNPAVLAEIARQNLVKASASIDSAATEAYHARRASEYFEYEPSSYQSEQLGWAQAPLSTSSSSPPHQASAAPGLGLGLGSQRSMLQQLDEGVVSNATASTAPYTSPDLRSLSGGPGSSVSGGGSAGARSREASYASMSGPIGAPSPYSTYASPGPGAAPLSPGLAAAAASAATAVVGAVPSAAARQAAMHPLGSPTSAFSSPALGGALAALRTQNPADMNAPKKCVASLFPSLLLFLLLTKARY